MFEFYSQNPLYCLLSLLLVLPPTLLVIQIHLFSNSFHKIKADLPVPLVLSREHDLKDAIRVGAYPHIKTKAEQCNP